MRVVVLTGGQGSRLWPLSRESFPKQFLHFGDGESLLQKTVRRMANFPLTEEIVLSTNAAYAPLVGEQVQKMGVQEKCHVLIEPERRNTAAAIALAVKHIEERCGGSSDEPILICPSDHFISPEERFYSYLEKAFPALQIGKIVIFGIRPYKPETGYGYVKPGEALMEGLFHVEGFFEKPDLQRAKEYFFSQNYFWNGGLFLFTPSIFWREVQEHAQELFDASQKNFDSFVEEFSHLPNLSIDYALMEKSQQVALCPMDLGWSDVGNWENVYELMEKDENQNVKIGHVIDIETKGSLIIGGKKLISTIGLEDLMIVETEEAIFIAKKGHSQRVKELQEKLS